MPDDYRISDLDTIVTVDNNDLFEISAVNQASPSGFTSMKIPVTKLAEKLATGIQYAADLKTSQKTLAGAINSVLNNLADEYDSTSTYTLDECCYHDGLLYKCTTAITTPEAWDSTHWTQIKAVDAGAGGGGGGGLSSDVIAPDYDSSQTYEVGDYVMHEDQLYVCNTAIITAEAWTAAHWTLTDVESMADDKVGGLIDDTQTKNNKTWSSQKISDEIINILPIGTASGPVASFKTSLVLPLVSCVADENATKLYHASKYGEQFHGLVIGNFAFVELSQLNWIYVEANQAFIANVLNDIIKKPATTSVMPYFISSKYDVVKRSEVVFGTTDNVITEQVTGSIIISDLDYTDAQALINSLQGEYLIYELETATTPTLTDAQFETLINAFDMSGSVESLPLAEMPITYIGENDIFADSGNVEVTYKKSIDDAIASLQALILNA